MHLPFLIHFSDNLDLSLSECYSGIVICYLESNSSFSLSNEGLYLKFSYIDQDTKAEDNKSFSTVKQIMEIHLSRALWLKFVILLWLGSSACYYSCLTLPMIRSFFQLWIVLQTF